MLLNHILSIPMMDSKIVQLSNPCRNVTFAAIPVVRTRGRQCAWVPEALRRRSHQRVVRAHGGQLLRLGRAHRSRADRSGRHCRSCAAPHLRRPQSDCQCNKNKPFQKHTIPRFFHNYEWLYCMYRYTVDYKLLHFLIINPFRRTRFGFQKNTCWMERKTILLYYTWANH